MTKCAIDGCNEQIPKDHHGITDGNYDTLGTFWLEDPEQGKEFWVEDGSDIRKRKGLRLICSKHAKLEYQKKLTADEIRQINTPIYEYTGWYEHVEYRRRIAKKV